MTTPTDNTTPRATPRMTPDQVRDAIRTAFKSLRGRGYFCRMNFTCCMTCAWYEVPEGREGKVVFYHRQDAQHLAEDGCCMLGWSGDGQEICDALREAGLKVEWNGSADTRIQVASH